MTRTIPLHGKKARGRIALVSDRDYQTVSQHRWWVLEREVEGQRTRGPYAVTRAWKPDGTRTLIAMHRMITGWAITDHKNHDGLDNRRSNLRDATRQQNGMNSRSHLGSTSQHKGVCWKSQSKGWAASIVYQGEQKFLGMHSTEVGAALAYDAAARELFGEFAVLNFPDRKPRVQRQGAAWMEAEFRRRRRKAEAVNDPAA